MTHRCQSAGDRWCYGIMINQLQLVMNLDFAKVIFVFLAWRRQHRARHLRHLNFRIVHHIKTDNKYRLYCWGAKGYWAIIWKIEENVSNAEKQEREASRVFSSLTLQTYQKHIQEAFKCFEWLSMTFLASFPKTETLENYCPQECNRKTLKLKLSFHRDYFFHETNDG